MSPPAMRSHLHPWCDRFTKVATGKGLDVPKIRISSRLRRIVRQWRKVHLAGWPGIVALDDGRSHYLVTGLALRGVNGKFVVPRLRAGRLR